MPWLTLGVLNMSGQNGLNWQQTPVGAVDQDLFRFSFLDLDTSQFDKIESQILIERVWDVPGDIKHREQNRLIVPTLEKVFFNWPILLDYSDAGFASYKIRVKKRYRYYKNVIIEPNYSIMVEVQ